MFENLKRKLQERIEKNAYKQELSWTDGSGDVHTETVYLKRSRIPLIGDWGRIYPPITEDGNIHWINFIFGGWKNFIKLLLIFGVLCMIYFGMIGSAREFMDGSKYVIMKIDTFYKFCSQSIPNGVESGIVSNNWDIINKSISPS